VFLVLDDVWKGKAFDSLDLAKGKGSVTLLSTRKQSLLKRASPHIRQEHMTPLSKEDSWSLFCVHAFRPPSNVPCELKALAQCMAEECQGVPLALKVIGRAMFQKASREWELLLKKLRGSRMQERPVEEELYERLKLDYDLLSEHDWCLKQCFHYFAAFPEDSRIRFDRVLCHWIGGGLVPAHDGDDPTEDAFSLLNKLWERSLIEPHGDIDGSLDKWDFLKFTVHDVMRDLAFYILEKDCGMARAESLGPTIQASLEDICGLVVLTKLRIFGRTDPGVELPHNIFALTKLEFLQLGLDDIETLPDEMPHVFKQLNELDLWGCGGLKYLPRSFTRCGAFPALIRF